MFNTAPLTSKISHFFSHLVIFLVNIYVRLVPDYQRAKEPLYLDTHPHKFLGYLERIVIFVKRLHLLN